jgi:hypothetical protein
VKTCLLESELLQGLRERNLGGLFDNESRENVVGIRVEPAAGYRQAIVRSRIGRRNQLTFRELVEGIPADDLPDRRNSWGLGWSFGAAGGS